MDAPGGSLPLAQPRHVVLIGMMGAGKSTVGRALAARLGVRYADNDEALVGAAGSSAASLAHDRGVDALHQLEWRVLDEALRRDDGAVVGAPGSIAFDEARDAVLGGQLTVWLRARPETLARHVEHDAARPLLGSDVVESLTHLAAAREPVYARLADVTVDVDGLTVGDVVERVLAALPEDLLRA